MIPRPPSWIRIRMIACPAGLKSLGVSLTIRPVTQMAEVDVKRAST
jgi:hypothetical protein